MLEQLDSLLSLDENEELEVDLEIVSLTYTKSTTSMTYDNHNLKSINTLLSIEEDTKDCFPLNLKHLPSHHFNQPDNHLIGSSRIIKPWLFRKHKLLQPINQTLRDIDKTHQRIHSRKQILLHKKNLFEPENLNASKVHQNKLDTICENQCKMSNDMKKRSISIQNSKSDNCKITSNFRIRSISNDSKVMGMNSCERSRGRNFYNSKPSNLKENKHRLRSFYDNDLSSISDILNTKKICLKENSDKNKQILRNQIKNRKNIHLDYKCLGVLDEICN